MKVWNSPPPTQVSQFASGRGKLLQFGLALLQCWPVKCYTLQYTAIYFNTMQCTAVEWIKFTALHCTTQYFSALHGTALHFSVMQCGAGRQLQSGLEDWGHCPLLSDLPKLHFTVLHHTALYCTTLHCTVLHCTVLYCTVLYCTTLHFCPLH